MTTQGFSEKMSIYKFLPDSEGLKDLYQANYVKLDNINIEEVDSLIFWVKEDSVLTDGDFIIIYHGNNTFQNDVRIVDFKEGRTHNNEDLNAWFTEIKFEFMNLDNLKGYKVREFELIDPKFIHPDSLSLSYNENSNQIIDENVSITDTKSLFNKSMYLKLKLENTDDVFVKHDESGEVQDTFQVIDMDNKRNTTKRPRRWKNDSL